MPKKKIISKNKTVRKKPNFFVHPTATVEKGVEIGENTKIWHFAQIRSGTVFGKNCIIGNSVFIDTDSKIGDNVKIQNHAIIYHQAIIDAGVFVGPNVCFTNDKLPRAINVDGTIKSADDWEISTIHIGEGSSIGAHSVITPGVDVGKWVLVGSGSVVTKNIPDFALAYGNPARIQDFVCKCGKRLKDKIKEDGEAMTFQCVCGEKIEIPVNIYKMRNQDRGQDRPVVWLR